MLIFPKVFGGLKESGALPYYGAENLTELTGYVGLLPLLLAAIGLGKWPQRSLTIFWLAVAVVAVVLAMGDATPLARIIIPFRSSIPLARRENLWSNLCGLRDPILGKIRSSKATAGLVFKRMLGAVVLTSERYSYYESST